MTFDLIRFIRESNFIEEKTFRDPHPHEIFAHDRFLALDTITPDDLERFVGTIQPGAVLRSDIRGSMVQIGGKFTTINGQAVFYALCALLSKIQDDLIKPWEAHVEYELLHPFTDGNGRSGRALWLWHMNKTGSPVYLDFLHHFYYDSLANARVLNGG